MPLFDPVSKCDNSPGKCAYRCMARTKRQTYDKCFHHVMNRGRRKEPIFKDDSDYRVFLDLLSKGTKRFPTEIHAYCLMGNHFHLIVRNVDGEMNWFIHWVVGQYVKVFNQKYEIDGPLFRDRYKSTVVDSEEYLVHLFNYVHRNPLAFLPEHQLHTYPFSSLGKYVNGCPDAWLSTYAAPSFSGLNSAIEVGAVYRSDSELMIDDLHRHLGELCSGMNLAKEDVEALVRVSDYGHLLTGDQVSESTTRKRLQRARGRLTKRFTEEQELELTDSVTTWLVGHLPPSLLSH